MITLKTVKSVPNYYLIRSISSLLHLNSYSEITISRFQFKRSPEIIPFPRHSTAVRHPPAILVVISVSIDSHSVFQLERSHLHKLWAIIQYIRKRIGCQVICTDIKMLQCRSGYMIVVETRLETINL